MPRSSHSRAQKPRGWRAARVRTIGISGNERDGRVDRKSEWTDAHKHKILKQRRRPMGSENVARKQPHQARARVTVGAILDGTVQILEKEGLDAATTTRIAEVAGVSIGSLYQYFPHRDAILNALQDREFERALAMLSGILAEGSPDRPPRETVRAVVHGLADLYRTSPGLHRVLAIEGLRVAEAERVHAFDRRVIEMVRSFLSSTHVRVRRPDLDAAAFVAFQAVRAVMLASLLERPQGLAEGAVVREVVDLLAGYLIQPEGDATR